MSDVRTRYFEATKQAAKAGDADAQMRHLQGEFGTAAGNHFSRMRKSKNTHESRLNMSMPRSDAAIGASWI